MRKYRSWRIFILMTSRCPDLFIGINQDPRGRIFLNSEDHFIMLKRKIWQKIIALLMTEFFYLKICAFPLFWKFCHWKLIVTLWDNNLPSKHSLIKFLKISTALVTRYRVFNQKSCLFRGWFKVAMVTKSMLYTTKIKTWFHSCL